MATFPTGAVHKPVHSYVWDIATLSWITAVQGGGGAGGDASAANQLLGNISLASIDTKTPTVGQKTSALSTPVVLASDQAAILVTVQTAPGTPITTNLTQVGNVAVSLGQKTSAASIPVVIPSDQTVPVSIAAAVTVQSAPGVPVGITATALPLPTGAAIEAGHLATIDTKTPALGQALSAVSTPVVIASDQTPLPISISSAHLDYVAPTTATKTFIIPDTLAIATSNHSQVVAVVTAITGGIAIAGSMKFQGTNDSGVTWSDIQGSAMFGLPAVTDPGTYVSLVDIGNTPLSTVFMIPAGGWQQVRLNVTALTGGSITFQLTASASAMPHDNTTHLDRGGTVALPLFTRPGDGTRSITVKAASTAAVAADTALVAALSPNTPLPAGTNVLGTVLTTIGSLANIAVDPTGNISTDAYNMYRLQEKQLMSDLTVQMYTMLNDERSTSQQIGYEAR